MEHENKTLADYFALLNRRRKILLWSLILISLTGVYVAYSIPAMFRSSSTFLIEEQNIPENIVQTTINSYVDEQIQEVKQRVMSAANLRPIIDEFGLYEELDEEGPPQLAIDEMRLNTLLETEVFDVINPRSGRPMLATISFTLSFDHPDAQTARDIAARLADLYLIENRESRTGQVQETLEFLKDDIDRYTLDVEITGQQLAEFKENNMGNLPELMNYNLQTIERTERQIDSMDREIRDAHNRQLQLSSDLAQQNPASAVYDESGTPIAGASDRLAELRREKLRLISIYSSEHPDVVQIEKEIDALSDGEPIDARYVRDLRAQVLTATDTYNENRRKYSESHPDVVASRRTLVGLEQELARSEKALTSSQSDYAYDDPYVRQLRLRIDAEEANIRSLNARKSELRRRLEDLESKVALSPRVESEYEILSRNNQNAVAKLAEVQAMYEDVQKAQKLETEGGAEKFTIIERANLPAAPYKPNRASILMLAVVLSVGVGIILATIVDTMDDSVKGSREVLALINAPPLAVIPYLETDEEHRKRVMANVMSIVTLAASIGLAFLIANVVG